MKKIKRNFLIHHGCILIDHLQGGKSVAPKTEPRQRILVEIDCSTNANMSSLFLSIKLRYVRLVVISLPSPLYRSLTFNSKNRMPNFFVINCQSLCNKIGGFEVIVRQNSIPVIAVAETLNLDRSSGDMAGYEIFLSTSDDDTLAIHYYLTNWRKSEEVLLAHPV